MRFAFAFPMSQLWAWVLIGLLAIGSTAYALRWLERRRDDRVHRMVAAHLIGRLAPGLDRAIRKPLFWYPLLAVVCLLLALAQPHWGQGWEEVKKASREVLFVLDTSESMRAEDVAPSRIDRARQKIFAFLDQNPADRVGLIAYSGAADLQSPLTVDHGYFKAVLSAVDTDTISLEGSDLAAALTTAVDVFAQDDEERGESGRSNRAVVVLADGEDVSSDAIAAAKSLSDFARVYVIGVGTTEGATVALPEWYTRFIGVENAARPHLSRLNNEALSRLALTGDGVYLQATTDNWDIEQLSEQLASLAARDANDELRYQLVNRYQWPLALGIIFAAADGLWIVLMPILRRRRAANLTDEEVADRQYA